MPKKFKGENSKAVVARARKAEAAAEEKAKKDKAIEDAYWNDDDKQVQKKMARKDEREKKRLADLEKKAELRALAKNEEEEVVPKVVPTPQKVTQYQLQKNIEEREAARKNEEQKERDVTITEMPLVENLNRLEDEVISASGIDAAVAALSVDGDSTDLHPEKRMASAFRAFEEKRLPQMKKENPNLRLSQLKQMLRKEWQKSPENPLNKRA
ncbi:coiled-coil domain-containing protein 124-like [Palaemon carinicauda]|uniref:coiled-coil domain-containing protein 124-like n=1 Tax=Palaemon carinicauda TaxID=392227 RepID=UPI0035B5D6AB